MPDLCRVYASEFAAAELAVFSYLCENILVGSFPRNRTGIETEGAMEVRGRASRGSLADDNRITRERGISERGNQTRRRKPQVLRVAGAKSKSTAWRCDAELAA